MRGRVSDCGSISYGLLALMTIAVIQPAAAAPGDPDPTFGDNGIVLTAVSGGSAYANDILIEPDGSILVSGGLHSRSDAVDYADVLVARYHADGQLDPDFGEGGVAIQRAGNGRYEGGQATRGGLVRTGDGDLRVATYASNGPANQ